MEDETKPISLEDIERLLRNYDLYGNKSQFYEKFPFEEEPQFHKMPLQSKFYKKPNPEFDKIFKDYIIAGSPIEDKRPKLEGHLYHGTSLDALDIFLEEGVLQPPVVLLKRGKLVSGELKADMDRDKNQDQGGPKFMSREAMIKMGMVIPDYHHIYEFGHAGDVFFSGHPISSQSYADKNPEKTAIIGIKRSIAEIHGAKFIDAKSEGILHEGGLVLWMSLKQLFVPRARVEEYEERAKAKYLAQVYPIGDMTLENLGRKAK